MNRYKRKKILAVACVFLSGFTSVLAEEKEENASWDWAYLQVVHKNQNPEVSTRSGRAKVNINKKRISIKFIDAVSAKSTDSPVFSGSISGDGGVVGSVTGFDFDFESEPMFGTYRSHAFSDGCVGYEIIMKDRLPRGRSILLSREECLKKD